MTEGSPRPTASAAAQQVQAIVAEAERDSIRAREAAGRLSVRADELERRLDELVGGVREALEGLRGDLADLGQETAAPATSHASEAPEERDELIAEVEAVAAKEPDVTAPEQAAQPEGARVIALKMALDGSPREDTARYLSENFELADPAGLLDEVYAKAGR